VGKAIKETRDKKATEDDDIPGCVLKLMGEDSLRRLMTQLINIIYGNGQWPKDLIEVAVIALKRPKATKCWDNCTCSKDSSKGT
jgi:hypothetical protein